MAGNIIILLVVSFLLWLVARFGPTAERPRQQLLTLTLFAFFCTVALLFNALLAYLVYDGLRAAANLPPLTTTAQLSDKQSGDPVNVVGTISPDNPILTENYVAYYECADNVCYPFLPLELLIRVDGGNILVSNNSYEDHAWPVESGVYYLAPEQPVVVAGITSREPTVDEENDDVAVEAGIVFAGTFEQFVQRAERQQIVPLVLLVANLLAAAVSLRVSISLSRFSSGLTQGNA